LITNLIIIIYMLVIRFQASKRPAEPSEYIAS